MRSLLVLLPLLPITLAACAVEPPYDEDWGADELGADLRTGKADGLLDDIPVLEHGDTVAGFVSGDNMQIFRLDARSGDRFELVMTVTSGDLAPHVSLYRGTTTYLHSVGFERVSDTMIRKVYQVDGSGAYIVAARAYEGVGAGAYAIGSTCLGGPCAGEVVGAPEISYAEVAECVTQARECAFAELPRYDGAVGDHRARLIFQDCLDRATTDEDYSCTNACEKDEDTQGLCNAVRNALPFYADASEDCLETLDYCLGECHEYAAYSSYDVYEIWDTVEYMCWAGGLNGECDSYARGHASCGGAYAEGTAWQCQRWCRSTTGAYIDDISDQCEDCGDVCASVREQCGTHCSATTGSCYDDCVRHSGTGYYCVD